MRSRGLLSRWLARSGALVLVAAGSAWATELRDAELVAGGQPVLENVSGTVRLEDARLGRMGPPVFVPEPAVGLQLGFGVGCVLMLAGKRGQRRP